MTQEQPTFLELSARLAGFSALAPGWDSITAQIDAISRFQDDWDGAGSPAPDHGAIVGAARLAKAMQAQGYQVPGRVTPGINGTVCFEWHTPAGYLEIEVTSAAGGEMAWVANGSAVAAVAVVALS